jgi:hypothetical protein
MARRSMDYERRDCRGRGSRGRLKLLPGQVVTLRHTHIRKRADLSIDEDDNRPSVNGRLDNLAR